MQWKRILIGFVPTVLVFMGHASLYLNFFIDDAFISLRYVQQWLAGNGLVYNIGDRVEGYSNFLWVVLLGLFGMAGVDLVVATRILGIGLSLATLFLVYRFVQRLPLPLFSPLVLGLSAPFAMWAVGGLENPLFMFLVFSGALLFYQEETRGAGWTSSICWGLLALTRPDGLLFGGIAVLYRSAQIFKLRQRPQRHDYMRGVVLAVIVGSYVAWRLVYYGYPLPNTFYAKSLGLTLRPLLEGGYYSFLSFEIMGGFFYCTFMVLLALTARHKYPFVGYFTVSAVAYVLFIFLAGGDWMPAQRFLTSVLPMVVVIFHVGLIELVALLATKVRPVAIGALIVGQLLYIGAISFDVRFVEPGIPSDHRLSHPYPWVLYLQEVIQESDTIAVFDAGFVAYQLPVTVRIVDMVGLTDRHIAHRAPQLPGGLWGRGDAWGRWDVDYVLAQNPRFVQFPGSMDSQGQWQTGFTGTTLLANDPRFRQRYRQTEMRGIFEQATDREEASLLRATSGRNVPCPNVIFSTLKCLK